MNVYFIQFPSLVNKYINGVWAPVTLSPSLVRFCGTELCRCSGRWPLGPQLWKSNPTPHPFSQASLNSATAEGVFLWQRFRILLAAWAFVTLRRIVIGTLSLDQTMTHTLRSPKFCSEEFSEWRSNILYRNIIQPETLFCQLCTWVLYVSRVERDWICTKR
jgi:hypothetical protein